MRHVAAVCVIVLFAASDLRAEVVKGEVKKVDADKGVLTVTVEKKDREFTIPKDAKVTIQVAAGVVDARDGLKNEWFKRAAKESGKNPYRVEVTVEMKEKKEVVTKVHLFTPTRRTGPGAGPPFAR
jgi:hypothetical protein